MFACSNIWLVGDSVSRGIVFDDVRGKLTLCKDSFFMLLRQKLSPKVENISKLGATILPGSEALEAHLKKAHPDLVAIEFGGNDCDYNWDQVALHPEAGHEPNTTPAVFEQALTHMVMRLKADGIIPVLINLPPIDAERYFRTITHGDPARSSQILSWLGNVTRIYSWHERYSVIVNAVAERTGTYLVDVRRSFLFTDHFARYIGYDGIHPNLEGHKLIASTLLDAIHMNCEWILSH